MTYSNRQKIGAAVLDWPAFELSLRTDWTRIRNRRERIQMGPKRFGAKCLWSWTSDLHVAKVFPRLGERLLRRCLKDWPVSFTPIADPSTEPKVSFIIGHRGFARSAQLLATLASIAGQTNAAWECIVVEQSEHPDHEDKLPPWVRYIHTPIPTPDLPYCRAWTLNVGARAARSPLIVLHDNDIVIPARYASELIDIHAQGYQLLDLKRFIFYLSAPGATLVQDQRDATIGGPPATVMQNNVGASIAVDRTSFLDIGGYDESFVGWGGEDNEFWERAQVLRIWQYGYLPMIHLWHPAQPGKSDPSNPTQRRYAEIAARPILERIQELKSRDFGNPKSLSV